MDVRFEGVYPVLPTPLKENQSPDLDAISELAEYYISKGVHGLVCLGSGGEFPYFSIEEKREIIKSITSTVRGRLPVIVGNGCMSARETLILSEFATKCGVDGFLMAIPTYYPLRFEEVYRYFKMVSEGINKPILYYHFPENTRIYLKPEEVAKICEIEGVVGIKESILNLREVRKHISLIRKKNFSVMSGTSFMFLDVLKSGGSGVICPVPLLLPETVVELYNSFKRGDLKRSSEMEKKLFRALPLLSDTFLPPAIARLALKLSCRLGIPLKAGGTAIQATFKEALRQMGLKISPLVRTPLMQIDEERKKLVKKVLKNL